MIRDNPTWVVLMADTRESENVQFLAGQVHALIGFCIAIINTHPSPAELSQHIEAAEHVTLAHVESTLVIEDFLDGVRNVFDRLKIAVADAEARQAAQAAAPEEISEGSDWEQAATAQVTKERQSHP
jgi:hypothetical protein